MKEIFHIGLYFALSSGFAPPIPAWNPIGPEPLMPFMNWNKSTATGVPAALHQAELIRHPSWLLACQALRQTQNNKWSSRLGPILCGLVSLGSFCLCLSLTLVHPHTGSHH